MAKKSVRGITTYTAYNFIDRDPIFEFLQTAVQQSGKSYKEIHEAGGATVGTIKRYFNGPTRTVKFDSAMATIKASGSDLVGKLPTGKEVKIFAVTRKK
jgi:hypothetical protein